MREGPVRQEEESMHGPSRPTSLLALADFAYRCSHISSSISDPITLELKAIEVLHHLSGWSVG